MILNNFEFEISNLNCMSLAFLLLIPVLFLENIKKMNKVIFLGVFLAAFSLLCIIIYMTKIIYKGKNYGMNAVPFKFDGTFLFISVAFTAIECY